MVHFGYFTMAIVGGGLEISAELKWHNMQWSDGKDENLSQWSVEEMFGSYYQNKLNVGTPGNEIELLFYQRGDSQYAEGIWTMQSSEEVRVALTRP